jgi:hypothetical protein
MNAIAATLLVVLTAGDAAAQESLSNTPVPVRLLDDLFGESPVPTLWATSANEVNGIRVTARAYRGRSGTPAAGTFLYAYELEQVAHNEGVVELVVPVPGRIALDLDGDTIPDTSAYCDDCETTGPPREVPFSVAANLDEVTFHFDPALAGDSKQLWLVSTHPPATAAASVSFALTQPFAVDVVAPGVAATAQLSNTSVSYQQLVALFPVNFGSSPGGDGYALGFHLYTGAYQGNAGTAAEGLYLYNYWLENPNACYVGPNDGPLVRSISVPFASIVPLDINGDGEPETSIYKSYGSGCGPVTAPTAVAFHSAAVRFDYPSGIGAAIADVYVVSDLPPESVEGTIAAEGLGTGNFATWSSAPEPGSVAASAAALLALAVLRGRVDRRRAAR